LIAKVPGAFLPHWKKQGNEMNLIPKPIRPFCRAFALVLLALAVPASLVAQEARGKITGRVVDSSKGAIPGATVTVTDVARNVSTATTSNAEGLFQVNYLVPGDYRVVVELSGFKKSISEGIEVGINQTRDLAVTLQVGGVEEVVTVNADAATINTTDGNMGLTVDAKRIAELPLIHGDPYKIMGLATGLAHSGDQRLDRPYEPTHIIGYAYDGTRSNRSDLLIDGSPSTATANANEVIATYVPPSDLVQEFRVQTATFDAQFGNTEGGVTSITIKSGTNQLHGSAYYFAEPSSLGANDFFGKARGQERVESSQDRPGFTLTGPLRIPGVYDGRDRTFFTLGYEHITDIRPRFDAGASVWVPTALMRTGNFSEFAGNIQIYDPLTRVSNGAGGFTATPFPGNVIPAGRISPAARAILEYYSLPKNPGLNGNIFDATLPETGKYNTTTFRLDQKVANNNRAFVRGSYYKRDSIYNDYLGTGLTATNFQFISYQIVADDVHTINNNTVLNVRYGWNRFERNSGQLPEFISNYDLTEAGFPASYNNLVGAESRRFPRIEFPANTMVGTAFGNDYRPVTSHSATATLNKAMGAHSAKAGLEMRIYREDSLSTGNNTSGRYVFDNAYTRQNSASGADFNGVQAYAAFLLGLPTTTEITRPADYSEYSKTYSLFVHDDWRVNSKLTLNLGIRWEVETSMAERNNKSVSNFDYAYTQPIEGTVQQRYAALNDPALKALVPQLSVKGGLLFVEKDTPKLYNTPKNTFLPRIGFAYALDPKTVIRGGVGLFAGFLGERRGDVIQPGYSQTTTFPTITQASGAPIPRSWDSSLTSQPILEPVGNSQGRQTSLGNGISFFNPDPAVSKQLRYQVSVQREIGDGIVVDAAYVGNYGYDIETFTCTTNCALGRNINALPRQYLNTDNSRTAAMNANNAFLTATVTNPFSGLVPGASINGGTTSRTQLLRPMPGYGDITTSDNEGKSWYNSVQLGIQKRFSKGYTLGVAYTLSKWEQATEYLNAADAAPTRVLSDLDVKHRLSVSAIVNVPVGKGRTFLSNASGATEAILGGWQVQGVYTYQSGFPVTFGNDGFWNGQSLGLPKGERTTLKWFKTENITSVVNGATANDSTPVNHLRTMPLRFDDVRRDSINSLDASLLKNIALKGRSQLQLRFEFVNALNSAYFPAPVVNPTATNFGQISASNQSNYARRAQIAAKVIF
jgi:hypothetical protein